MKYRLAQLYNIVAEEYKEEQDYKNMNANLSESKKYARQCRQLKKTYGGAYFELGVAELNLCNKSSGIKALKQAAKYDRRYRSEVKRIIKKIDDIINRIALYIGVSRMVSNNKVRSWCIYFNT